MDFTKTEPTPIPDLFPMMSPEGQNLIDWCLQLDPNQRPSAQEALKHPYFTTEEPAPCDPSELPIKQLLKDLQSLWSKKTFNWQFEN